MHLFFGGCKYMRPMKQKNMKYLLTKKHVVYIKFSSPIGSNVIQGSTTFFGSLGKTKTSFIHYELDEDVFFFQAVYNIFPEYDI